MLKSDNFIIVPNFIGLCLASVQIYMFFLFPESGITGASDLYRSVYD